MTDAYETLVRWYLRFNGFVGVENFVVHEPIDDGNRQGGETDIIAVRFPHSHEVVGFPIVNDCRLFDEEVAKDNLTDFVIAEVKTSKTRSGLNEIWIRHEELYLERVAYLIRWIGILPDEKSISEVAAELKTKFRSRKGIYLVRLIYFGMERQMFVSEQGISQITITDILKFFFQVRTPCYKDHHLGVRSPHNQWEPLIKQIWGIGDPTLPDNLEERIQKALVLLETAKVD